MTIENDRLSRDHGDRSLMGVEWLEAVEKTGWGRSAVEEVLPQDQASEYLMMSLRLAEGSDMERFAKLNGTALDAAVLRNLQEGGFITYGNQTLTTTQKGRPVLNEILRQLLAG